jgi:glycosyltransferase involved in cell wall biosynthesis
MSYWRFIRKILERGLAMNNVHVSIVCAAYNHEKYIADAIDSFLMQKTNFEYEILIHDDASTDKTTEIIKKYERHYPEKIRPIYQYENQYSKGVKISPTFLYPKSKGRYIAICEGDDYWLDPYKLQKQVDYMEEHSECSVCVHASKKIDTNTKKEIGVVRPSNRDRDFDIEEVIIGGGGLFATNSILFRKQLSVNIPRFYDIAPVGDYPLIVYLALCGDVHYIDEYMSVYRVGVSNSWSQRMSNANIEKRQKHVTEGEKMLEEIDKYTNYQYSNIINKKIIKNKFDFLIFKRKYKEAKTGIYKEYYKSLSIQDKLKILLKQYFPVIHKVYKLTKRKCK